VKRYAWLIALGAGALLAFAIATLPAGLVAGRLGKFGVQATSFGGSLWSGRADGLKWRGTALGDLEWRLTPLSLLRGTVAGHARLVRDDGSLDSDFSVALTGNARLSQMTFAFPVETLGDLPIGVPKGWRGKVSGALAEILISGGWVTAARGTVDMDELVAPPPRDANVGGFHVVLPHPDPQGDARLPDHLSAHVTDKNGPFAVDAQLTIGKDRSFLLEGTVAPRGAVPEDMARSLELLGPADAAGRRPFSVSGTL
jgi:general secretion pathway protein N